MRELGPLDDTGGAGGDVVLGGASGVLMRGPAAPGEGAEAGLLALAEGWDSAPDLLAALAEGCGVAARARAPMSG